VQSKTIIDLLRNDEVVKFIGLHINDDVKLLALEAHKHQNMDIKAISTLILLYQKAKLKLPEHYKNRAALAPKCYEQCTSEMVAKYKANIMDIKAKKIVNITGGLGIDDWAMSEYALQIDSCEIDSDIHDLAIFNNKKNNILNITRHLIDGIEYVKNLTKTDLIYADPDRRPAAAKVFKLEDSLPNILSNIDLLLSKADQVWLKISPMADITYLEKSISSIKKIYIIAWLGEVKEILVCCNSSDNLKKTLAAVNIGSEAISIFESNGGINSVAYGNSGNYLYEPNKAIIKAGLTAHYGSKIGLKMISVNSHFFISDFLVEGFYGRTFDIIERLEYKPKLIKVYLEKNAIRQANITTRNFRETPELLKKRFKIKDGGAITLCFSIDSEGKSWLFHCKQRINKD